jgi:hypothetical protein
MDSVPRENLVMVVLELFIKVKNLQMHSSLMLIIAFLYLLDKTSLTFFVIQENSRMGE